MRRVNLPPKAADMTGGSSQGWISAVTERMNVYEQPTFADLPEGQWCIAHDGSTLRLYVKFGGTIFRTAALT